MSATIPDESVARDLTARVATLEHVARDTRDALDRIERRFDKVDARFDKMEAQFNARFDRADARMDRIDDRIDANFRWLLTMGPGGFAALLATMAHGFHWV